MVVPRLVSQDSNPDLPGPTPGVLPLHHSPKRDTKKSDGGRRGALGALSVARAGGFAARADGEAGKGAA